MFSKMWKTSERKYGIVVEHDVKIRLNDGTVINADIFHPDSDEKFPAIFAKKGFIGCNNMFPAF